MIKLYMNGMEVGTIPDSAKTTFLASEEYQFWKKNCEIIQIHEGTLIRPNVIGNYQNISFTHVVEFTGETRRVPDLQETMPTSRNITRSFRTKVTRSA